MYTTVSEGGGGAFEKEELKGVGGEITFMYAGNCVFAGEREKDLYNSQACVYTCVPWVVGVSCSSKTA